MTQERRINFERMRVLKGDSPVKAFCDMNIGGVFVVRSLRIVEGPRGLFLGMPQEKGKDGKWYKTFYTTSNEIKDAIQEKAIKKYEETIAEVKEPA
jgi:stage V sporulation protein G